MGEPNADHSGGSPPPVAGRFDAEASRWTPRNIVVLVLAGIVALVITAGALFLILQYTFTRSPI